MTETTGLATAQPLGCPVLAQCGQALPGVEIRIADDDEILLRGPNMVSGYLHMPEQSAALYTDDGWMRTGDLGALDQDGFLSITGRKKDLLITAGGKNVAPAEMENHLQGIPGVGQAVVVGDRQPYLCAILALEEEAIPDLCQAAGVSVAPLAEVASNEKVRAFLADRVESDCNSKVARYQTIKKFEVLPHMLSVEGGELTPTMKVKRNVINDKYKAIIDGMYASGAAPASEARPAPECLSPFIFCAQLTRRTPMRKSVFFIGALLALSLAVVGPAVAEDPEFSWRSARSPPKEAPGPSSSSGSRPRSRRGPNGRLKVKLRLGRGNERSLARRVQMGSMQAFAGSVGGMSSIVREVNVIETPYVFESFAEADKALDNPEVTAQVKKVLSKRGLIFGIWAENGYRSYFSWPEDS